MYPILNVQAVEVAALLEIKAEISEGPFTKILVSYGIFAPTWVGSVEFWTLTPCIEGIVSTAIRNVPPTPLQDNEVIRYAEPLGTLIVPKAVSLVEATVVLITWLSANKFHPNSVLTVIKQKKTVIILYVSRVFSTF
jgi:hypothetical protein